MQTKHALLLLPIAAMLFACTGKESSTEAGKKSGIAWGTAAMYIERPIAQGDTLCYQIDLKLDTISGDSMLAASLNDMLHDSVLYARRPTVQATMAAYADSIEAEWKAEIAEMYEPEAEFKDMFQYYLTMKGTPMDNGRKDVLSYMVHTECYLGGAHGSHDTRFYNFDTESGKLISIDDIIPAGRRKEALEAMGEQLCADYGVATLADLQEQTGITMLGDLYLTNNFFLHDDSITFIFNIYEIAPYACGAIDVTIPSVPNP